DLTAGWQRTGAVNNANVAGADCEVPRSDNRPLLLDLGAGHFVRRENGNHLLDSFPCFQGLFGAVALLAQSSDDGAVGTNDDMAAQPEFLDALDDVINLPLARAPFHNNNHGCSFWKRLRSVRAAFLRPTSEKAGPRRKPCGSTVRNPEGLPRDQQKKP